MSSKHFKKKKHKASIEELGFSEKIEQNTGRLIHKDGRFNIERTGFKSFTPYQDLKEISWLRFFMLIFLFVILVNVLFAALFVMAGIEHLNGIIIGNGAIDNFFNAFFFSIQTFTTVGYGAINPTGIAANIIASIDALVGLLTVALFTGLFFARFSRPIATILFSDKALMTPMPNGKMSFQFRIVNARDHKIIDVEAKVLVTWLEEVDGFKSRQYASLSLVRDKIFLFPLNWTVVHIVNEKSPLFGKSKQDLIDTNAEFLVLVEGHDEIFSDRVHANRSYFCHDLLWNVKFEIMHYPEDGQTILDLDKINNIVSLDAYTLNGVKK